MIAYASARCHFCFTLFFFSDFDSEKEVAGTVLMNYEESMDNGQTQVALIFFSAEVNTYYDYSYNYQEIRDYLDNYRKDTNGGTETYKALQKAIEMIKEGSDSRWGFRKVYQNLKASKVKKKKIITLQ